MRTPVAILALGFALLLPGPASGQAPRPLRQTIGFAHVGRVTTASQLSDAVRAWGWPTRCGFQPHSYSCVWSATPSGDTGDTVTVTGSDECGFKPIPPTARTASRPISG